MKKRINLSLLLILITFTVLGQDINQTDTQGRKQGVWKKYYPSNDGLFYEGQFKDDKAVGSFKHYYENGDLKSITIYGDNRVRSEVYYNNGQLMATGVFIDQKKDSTWLYFDRSGWLSLKEDYKMGLKSGPSISYFPNGSIALNQMYSNDLENGAFIMYYANGNKEIEGTYMGGNYNGLFTNYYESGKKMQSGDYINGKRSGMWLFFNTNGSLKTVINYNNGIIIKESPKNGEFIEYYDSGMTKSVFHYKKGLKEGAFIEYYDDGEKVLVAREKESEYEPDDYKEEIQGQTIKRKGIYKAGELSGEEIYFDEKGSVIKKEMH